MRARVFQRGQDFAGEAVISYSRDGAFDAGLVPSMAYAGGVDMKVACLRILEKRRGDPRCKRIRIDDDRLGVIWNEDVENPAEKLSGDFAGFNRARGRFFERGIHEPIP